MTKLSDSQRVILSAAAQHEMGLARAPKTLPAAARNAVFRSLIKNNLLTEINAPREHVGLGWRQDEDGTWIVARITDEGLRAIGIDPNEGDAAVGGPDCSGIEGSVPYMAPTGADDGAERDAPAEVAEPAQDAPTAHRAVTRQARVVEKMPAELDLGRAQRAFERRRRHPGRQLPRPERGRSGTAPGAKQQRGRNAKGREQPHRAAWRSDWTRKKRCSPAGTSM
jgi:hypothetical protein